MKVYTSEKAPAKGGSWHHTRITLKPLNPSHAAIVLMPQHEDEVRVIAEFVQVVGTPELRGVREAGTTYEHPAGVVRKVAERGPRYNAESD